MKPRSIRPIGVLSGLGIERLEKADQPSRLKIRSAVWQVK